MLTAALPLILITVPMPSLAKTNAAQEGMRARQARTFPAGEVVVVLNEELFSALLNAMLLGEKPLTFPLTRNARRTPGGETSGAYCASEATLLRESGGVRTAVVFREGKITVPIAFRGSYEAPLLGCLKFEGSAATTFDLVFDATRQALTGRVTVQSISLTDTPAMLGSTLTGLVQTAIDNRINPIEILRADQLGAKLPVTPDTVLRLRAREIRNEVVGKELRLRIFYEVVRDD
ncbi:MAG: hypothetical protein M3430_10880 [Acidobacteriota bacterium]|nr:hypothetical protein [Acidobacteriota bacterium]